MHGTYNCLVGAPAHADQADAPGIRVRGRVHQGTKVVLLMTNFVYSFHRKYALFILYMFSL